MSHGGKGSNPRPFSVDQTTFANNWEQIFGKKHREPSEEEIGAYNDERLVTRYDKISADKPTCYCYNCNKDRLDESGLAPYVTTRMIVCPQCGNKRCPHSTDHNLECTNSNEPGQAGSRY